MEPESLFFVISSHYQKPQIVQATAQDYESLKIQHINCKIRKYTKYEEAKSYLDAYEDMKYHKILVDQTNTPASIKPIKKVEEVHETKFDDTNLTDEERARLMDIVKDERKKVQQTFKSIYESHTSNMV